MSDIVERLCLLVPSDSSGAAFDAVNEITALRAEIERFEKGAVKQAAACGRLLRELHAAQAENERLLAALNGVVREWEEYTADEHSGDVPFIVGVTMAGIARAALSSADASDPWRPIGDEPEHAMRVLLFSPDHYDADWNGADYGIRVAYFSDGEWRDQGTNHDAFEYDTPTHWMLLPPPPKKENTDD